MLEKHIDHTNLKPFATLRDIRQLCDEARKYNFRGICVNPGWVPDARAILSDTDIKVITVVGFPLGANHRDIKIKEAKLAVECGADELDVVWDLGLFKAGRYLVATMELAAIVKAVKVPVKIIVETCYLTIDELEIAHSIVKASGAEYIKTSTGFGEKGATLLDVMTWKSLGGLKIKAAGGIKTYRQALEFMRAGADILGTSSGVNLMEKENANPKLP